MDKAVIPVVAHKLDHLEPLCKVERLSGGGDVDALVKTVGIHAVDRRRDVA